MFDRPLCDVPTWTFTELPTIVDWKSRFLVRAGSYPVLIRTRYQADQGDQRAQGEKVRDDGEL